MLVGALFAGPSAEALTPVSALDPTHIARCSQIRWKRGVEQRERLIRCVFRRLNPTVALAVARCESGPNLDPRAAFRGSLGLFQHQAHLFRARALRYLRFADGLDPARVSPYNAYANALITARMVGDRQIGWGPWSCA